MCEHSDGRTAKVFVFLQLIARPSFLKQFDRESNINCGEVKPIVREKSRIVGILQISHQRFKPQGLHVPNKISTTKVGYVDAHSSSSVLIQSHVNGN